MQLQGTNTYLIGTGREKLLIDTGEGKPSWIQHIAYLVQSMKFSIQKILLTHWHRDHTAGCPDLLQHFPDLKTAVYKCEPATGQGPIVDGQVFTVPGATVRAIHTSGHTSDHMCFLLEEENAIFTGDTLLGHGTTAIEDMTDYMTSLRKLQESRCQTAYPGHGAVVSLLSLRLEQEIARTLYRERQMLMALKSIHRSKVAAGVPGKGSATLDELVHEVFGKLPPYIVETVFQPLAKTLLMKLAGEKRVGFEFRGGQKGWFAKE
jgi:hydrolase